jgi:3-phosphoglycerate kinase
MSSEEASAAVCVGAKRDRDGNLLDKEQALEDAKRRLRESEQALERLEKAADRQVKAVAQLQRRRETLTENSRMTKLQVDNDRRSLDKAQEASQLFDKVRKAPDLYGCYIQKPP